MNKYTIHNSKGGIVFRTNNKAEAWKYFCDLSNHEPGLPYYFMVNEFGISTHLVTIIKAEKISYEPMYRWPQDDHNAP
jgi:hypothetical protein